MVPSLFIYKKQKATLSNRVCLCLGVLAAWNGHLSRPLVYCLEWQPTPTSALLASARSKGFGAREARTSLMYITRRKMVMQDVRYKYSTFIFHQCNQHQYAGDKLESVICGELCGFRFSMGEQEEATHDYKGRVFSPESAMLCHHVSTQGLNRQTLNLESALCWFHAEVMASALQILEKRIWDLQLVIIYATRELDTDTTEKEKFAKAGPGQAVKTSFYNNCYMYYFQPVMKPEFNQPSHF